MKIKLVNTRQMLQTGPIHFKCYVNVVIIIVIINIINTAFT